MKNEFDSFDSLFLVDVEDEDGETSRTLSFSRSPTVLLTFAANRFTRAAAKTYAEKFGIGAVDWRMLVMLTRKPGATVTESANTIGIDKGAVSRCISRLEELALVRKGDLHANGRSRGWWLTEKGKELHACILEEALERQRMLLDGFTYEEIEAFTDMLRRFVDNLSNLNSRENE
ncbi:MAG: winged helix-turn-helix transcriptional regulator [Maritimibacter sp.]|uniref:MarR family winged helix-turn-helix transcriptional regulator n=1 Tax=Maritimibacter sp. TaxID=2003363 RepID=UPI001DB85D35|nr:MarR family winged helix-turn-helix transcriptional regulator [Maritimibacter sp.]MBL6428956.1 winged helix-turn-helix transcriptional regulator [Maritimibacter sp.]